MKKMLSVLLSLLFLAGTTVIAQDQDQIRLKDRIHQEDHLMLKDGSCLLVQDGVPSAIQSQMRLNNGTIVNPDGSYQLQNQQRYQLKNGEYMDMDGNRYLNQNKFNNRVQMTNRQIERARTNYMNKNMPANKAGTRRNGNPKK